MQYLKLKKITHVCKEYYALYVQWFISCINSKFALQWLVVHFFNALELCV